MSSFGANQPCTHPCSNVDERGGASRDVAKTESEISSHSLSHSHTQPNALTGQFTPRNLCLCGFNSADELRLCAFVLMNIIHWPFGCVRQTNLYERCSIPTLRYQLRFRVRSTSQTPTQSRDSEQLKLLKEQRGNFFSRFVAIF